MPYIYPGSWLSILTAGWPYLVQQGGTVWLPAPEVEQAQALGLLGRNIAEANQAALRETLRTPAGGQCDFSSTLMDDTSWDSKGWLPEPAPSSSHAGQL